MSNQAVAIWWDVNKQTLRARGANGTATFGASGHGEPVLHHFEGPAGRWSNDDANPRRNSANTITLTAARKLVLDMVEAVKARSAEADERFKADPSMSVLYSEQESARYAEAVAEMSAYLAANPNPASWLKDARTGLKLSDAIRRAGRSDEGCVVELNPWMTNARVMRQYMENTNCEAQYAVTDARILFVLFGTTPAEVVS